MKIPKSKITIIALSLLIVGITAFGINAFTSHGSSDTSANTAGLKDVDLEPVDENDKKQTDSHKEDLSKKLGNEANVESASGIKAVTPVVTDSSQYGSTIEVRAYVPGIIEENGICEINFSQGNTKIVKLIDGIGDATTTRCSNLYVERNEFPTTGSWNVTVRYSSPSAAGSSPSSILEVR